MIELTITRKERVVEVYNSMPKPIMECFTFVGDPGATIILENEGGIVKYTYVTNSSEDRIWVLEEIKKGVEDPHADLKRVFEEGAIIEVEALAGRWVFKPHPSWKYNCNYRIKGGITIEQWNKHNVAIKAGWQGERIEGKGGFDSMNWVYTSTPNWDFKGKFRAALKPCPFCGGNAEVDISDTFSTPSDIKYDVCCEKCGATLGTVFNTPEEARKAWNRRA